MESIEQAEGALIRCIVEISSGGAALAGVVVSKGNGFFKQGRKGTGHIGSVSLRDSRSRISSPWGS